MLGCLLLRVRPVAETSKGILGGSKCVSNEEALLKVISVSPSSLKRVSDMTTSYFVGLILTKFTSRCSGSKSTIRLWLIFAGCVVAIDLPGTLLVTWLRALLGGIAILGRGSGVALRKAGHGLRDLLAKVATIFKRA
ncbi:hypothetical protein ES703_119397 [subsurface metagenome]